MKQKGGDYKLTVVKYYLNNDDTMDNTCKIFDLLYSLYLANIIINNKYNR